MPSDNPRLPVVHGGQDPSRPMHCLHRSPLFLLSFREPRLLVYCASRRTVVIHASCLRVLLHVIILLAILAGLVCLALSLRDTHRGQQRQCLRVRDVCPLRTTSGIAKLSAARPDECIRIFFCIGVSHPRICITPNTLCVIGIWFKGP
jgi:hypothetical protein